MVKQIWVAALVLIFSSTTSNTFARTDDRLMIDTSDLSPRIDSTMPAVAVATTSNPKDGFKDLFINASGNTAYSSAELNPLAIDFVEEYIERFSKSMEELKGWGRPYFDMMDGILEQHGLPKELKYLAVIESNLKSNARSWAGAVGPWQFMPATARNMGLRVNRKVDDRRDLHKSTHAASKYLHTLYGMYGDWLLVIAAYNGGPGKVNAAIKRSGSNDFWKLQQYLPLESRNHVKKFIATHYMLEGQGGVTTLTKAERADYQEGAVAAADSSIHSQAITGRYNSTVVIRHLQMDAAGFHKINPGFDKAIATNGQYQLRLPQAKMELFLAKKFDILAESVYLILGADNASRLPASR